MKRAAAYARYSSQGQREESIDAQMRGINEFAAANNYQITARYIDRAQSARSDDRPEFQNMIEDSGKKLFDAVIVHKLDRFSRDRFDSAVYRRRLRVNGVTLVSVLERLDGSPESVILESVIDGMAEYYSKNLAREVKKGMRENALQARHNGGSPPLGYVVNPDKTYAIEPLEADTVKRIFDMYANECSYKDIIEEMNRLGRLTKRGKPFWKNSLHEILKNEKYIGVYIFNRRYKSRINGKSNMHKRRNESEIIRIEGAIPRIVDDITWGKVRKRMENNIHGEQKAKEMYLLSGLIYCGGCGERMNGNRRKSGSKDRKTNNFFVSYTCSHQCKQVKGIKRDEIEEAVIKDLQQRMFTLESATAIAEEIQAEAQKRNREMVDRIKETKSLYAEASKHVQALVDAVAQGMYRPEMNDLIAVWGERKDALAEELAALERTAETTGIASKEKVVEYLLSQSPLMGKSPKSIKSALNRFIERVTVYNDRAEIKLKVDPSPAVFDRGRGEPIWTTTTAIYF